MDKYKLIQMKKRLIALSMVGVILGTLECSRSKTVEPERDFIPDEYSNVEDYYKYVVKNGDAIKLYNSQNVYLLYDKETYEVSEYIFRTQVTYFGGAELYDLESEEMFAYGNGIATTYNGEYYKYIVENNYQVCLSEVSDYVEEHSSKDYYSLDEIRKLEPQIRESLRIINEAKVKIR